MFKRLGQGRDRALQYLKENPILHDEIEKVWMHNLLILLFESHSLFYSLSLYRAINVLFSCPVGSDLSHLSVVYPSI
jgi:hypothetical protein